MPKVRRRTILVLGRDDLADQVIVALRREGHRARRLDWRDPTAPDLSPTASQLDPAVLDLTPTAIPLEPTAPDLTPAANLRDPAVLDPAVLDPARTPVLILADPPDAPDLVARLLELARERASQLQPRWWSVMKAGRQAVGQAGRQGRPGPVQRLILMHPRDPAPVLPACEPDDPLQIETFAIEDRAARALFRRWPPHMGLDPGFDQVPHLLFLGFAPPARALLLQALLLAHYGQGRPRISLVCDRHEAVAAELLAAYPQASFIADLRFAPFEELSSLLQPADAPDLNSPVSFQPPRPHGLGSLSQATDSPAPSPLAGEGWGEGAEGLHVSAPRDRPPSDLANHSGLALAHRLIEALATSQGVSPPVLLEVGAAEPEGGIEDWDGQIIPFDYQREACRAALLLDGAGDELARTIHEHYRDTIAAQGRDLTQEPAGQPWERLATSYRQANRHQADHVWAKLAVTDCRAVAEDLVEVFALTPLEVERLAIVEHARWAADRYLDGWSYGPVRDNARKLHPQLIPYAELSEAMKDLDRFAVRGLPTLAARLGLGIQRLLILGIHPPGPACPSGKPLQRLATGLRERLRERYPDRALVIAATLADHRERDLVRELMEGAEGASLFLLLPHPLSHLLARLSPTAARREFLTLLAQAERRISLRGEGELAAWFARRAEIQLILGETLPCLGDATSAPGKASDTESRAVRVMTGLAGGPAKRILLDPDGPGLTWTFDY